MADEFDRSRAAAALSRVDLYALSEAVDHLVLQYPVEATANPEAGLVLLRLAEKVNDPFNLGPVPMSTASVSLRLPDGTSVIGSAQIMSDDAELASMLAICDAALFHELEGADAIKTLLADGLSQLQREQDLRKSLLDFAQNRFLPIGEEPNV